MAFSQQDLDKVFCRDVGVLAAALDDELVLLSINGNKYFGSGEIGCRIWQLLDGTRTLLQLCEQLLAEYDVAAEVCSDDVLGFVNQLFTARLVTLVQSDTR